MFVDPKTLRRLSVRDITSINHYTWSLLLYDVPFQLQFQCKATKRNFLGYVCNHLCRDHICDLKSINDLRGK